MVHWRVGKGVEIGKRVIGKRHNYVPKSALAARAVEESILVGRDAEDIVTQEKPAKKIEDHVDLSDTVEDDPYVNGQSEMDYQLLDGLVADDCPMCDDFFLTTGALEYIAGTYRVSISAEALADPKKLSPAEHRQIGDVLGAIVVYDRDACKDLLDDDIRFDGIQDDVEYHKSCANCLDPELVLEMDSFLRIKGEKLCVKSDFADLTRVARRGYEIPTADLVDGTFARIEELLYSNTCVCDCEMPTEDQVGDHWLVAATNGHEDEMEIIHNRGQVAYRREAARQERIQASYERAIGKRT
jgi:hypothetical protein